MKSTDKISLLGMLLLTVVMASPARAAEPRAVAQPQPESGFYGRHSEGWFWYAEPPDLPPEEDEPPSPPPPPPVPPPAAAAPAPPEGPPPLSAAWLREHLPKALDQALDNPSKENVSLYFHLQRVAVDKSQAFTDQMERVVLGDAVLDENMRRPMATFAANKMNEVAGDQADAMMSEIAKTAGIWFFYRSNCPYCHQQVAILKVLERQYGFRVLAISTDGLPLPGGVYPQFQINQGQAEQLGVQTVPALFLVRPPNDIQAIAQGAVALDDLQRRVLITAVRAKWITEEAFARTRTFEDKGSLATVPPPADTQIVQDPERLVEYLRSKLRR
jgi:conjugal transfer pilus assembly protein TraF